tara:strand:+ start:720 stop:1472 length:753 start_codon:yes stop_codon:yes gene_type:complete
MKYCGLIPARYNSSRFPGKALCDLNGKTMIRRTFESVSKWNKWEKVYVVTDDKRIVKECKKHSIPYIVTSENHQDGIDRCAEAAKKLYDKEKLLFDRYILIQGDEPMFNPKTLDVDLSSEIVGFYTKADKDDLNNPNVVKVVVDRNGRAIYLSRLPIPYDDATTRKNYSPLKAIKQTGVYSFTFNALQTFNEIGVSYLESVEGIGLLRLIEQDITIQMKYTPFQGKDVNTKEDQVELTSYLKQIEVNINE